MSERTILKPASVDLGNETLKLLFDFDILVAMEEADFDLNGLEERMKGKTFTTLRRLLWFGAQREQPDLKLEAIGAMIDLRVLDRVSDDVMAALESQMPPKKETNPQKPPAAE